jgi:acetoin utilization protein AcuB
MDVDRWSVAKWMSKRPKITRPDAVAADAAEIMREHRIRHVPVVDGDRVVGMVSDRDVRPYFAAKGRGDGAEPSRLERLSVREIMTPLPFSVSTSATLREAAELVCREKIGALPVLEHGKLVGIVSAEDLLWAFAENCEAAEFVRDAGDE